MQPGLTVVAGRTVVLACANEDDPQNKALDRINWVKNRELQRFDANDFMLISEFA